MPGAGQKGLSWKTGSLNSAFREEMSYKETGQRCSSENCASWRYNAFYESWLPLPHLWRELWLYLDWKSRHVVKNVWGRLTVNTILKMSNSVLGTVIGPGMNLRGHVGSMCLHNHA